MSKILKPKSHQEWLELRTHGIGASEVGTIMGVNKYQTLYQLWQSKKNAVINEDDSNSALLWGHLLEPVVAELYSLETGCKIVKSSSKEIIYVAENKPYMRISPDRLYYPKGVSAKASNLRLLECKTSLMPISEDDVPKPYFCQVQYQMHVSGIHHCTLAWMNLSNRTFGYKDFEYDKQFCDYMESKVTEFWTHYIVGNEEPPVTSENDVKCKYPVAIQGSIVTADTDAIDAVEHLKSLNNRKRELNAEIRTIEEQMSPYKIRVQSYMGDNENLMVAGYDKPLITWKSKAESEEFDTDKFAAENPSLYRKYLRRKAASRTFVIK